MEETKMTLAQKRERKFYDKMSDYQDESTKKYEAKREKYEKKYSKLSTKMVKNAYKSQVIMSGIHDFFAGPAEEMADASHPLKTLGVGVFVLAGAAFLAGGVLMLTKNPLIMDAIASDSGFLADLLVGGDPAVFCKNFGGIWTGLGSLSMAFGTAISRKFNMAVYKMANNFSTKHQIKSGAAESVLRERNVPYEEYSL